MELEDIGFHLRGLVEDSLELFKFQASEKSINIEVNFDLDLPECVEGDPTRLRQVLINLIGNAVKFTNKGKVVISCKQSPDQPGFIHFTVADTGIGMTKEQLDKVFDLFSQADNSTTRRFGGTGLGTCISKRLIELMNGKIWVESKINEGTRFHFLLHLPESKSEIVSPINEPGNENLSFSLQPGDKLKEGILLAEDNLFNQQLIGQQLALAGYRADFADDGKLAKEMWQNGNYKLIICDISMPVMDGYQLLASIRDKEKSIGSHTPIIALTANALSGEKEKCIELGFDDYCSKPISLENLKNLLNKWL